MTIAFRSSLSISELLINNINLSQEISNLHSKFRNKIQVSKEEALEKLTDWEMINQKLKSELKDATQQLIVKSNELMCSKTELQRHRQEIDVS